MTDGIRKTVIALALGGLAALAVEAYHHLLLTVEWLLYAVRDGHLVPIAASLPLEIRIVLPAAGGLAAGALLWARGRRVSRRAAPPAFSSDYLEAVRADNGRLDTGGSLVKIAASVCVVVTGSAIGREGAMILLAALTAAWCARNVADDEERKLWVACGIAGGVAGAYHAPLAGGLFVAEVFFGSFALRSIWPVFVAAVAAMSVTGWLGSYVPLYRAASVAFVWGYLVPLAGLSLLAGVCGPVYLRAIALARHLFRRLRLAPPWQLASGGLLVGGLAAVHPEVWGNGYSVIATLLTSPPALPVLAGILLFKFAAIACSSGSGAPGGIFTPTLFMGAALGAVAASALSAYLPEFGGLAPLMIQAGMAALLAAVTRAPAMASVMICELIGDWRMLPLLYGLCLLSVLIARLLRCGSIYDSH